MSQALAQTISYVERARAFMPQGTVPPFVVRFDVGSVPIGQLVFSSETRSVGEIQDLALFRVRPMFATLPGVSAPPPFGGNQRTIVITVDPDKLRAYNMSAEEVVKAVATGNTILPAGTNISFEAGDIVSQIMNFGAPTPIEVAINGPDLNADLSFAKRVMEEMKKISALRDLQFGQPLDYPTIDIKVDRKRAGQLGVTVDQVGRSLVAATSSSRFTQPNYWCDPSNGIVYQVQVQMPQAMISSIEDIESIPAMPDGTTHLQVGDVAQISYGKMPGEYDRYNMQRMITITANVVGKDLGTVANEVSAAIQRAGEPPRGVAVNIRGQVTPMNQTLFGLKIGLAIAIIVIFLFMASYFQSFRVALVVLSSIPAVIAGITVILWITGTTLNVQSFMGAIMAIGVSVANAILLVTFTEQERRSGQTSDKAAVEGAKSRFRPILMTNIAMIAGMIPMAAALGEGGEQTAPLGRAVIGGLTASTFAVLLVLPLVFTIVRVMQNVGSYHCILMMQRVKVNENNF